MIWYNTKSRLFVWTGPFESRSLAHEAGFVWVADQNIWATNDLAVAKKLSQFMTSDCKKQVQILERKAKLAYQHSFMTDADICVPCPEGEQFFPFQRAGILLCMLRQNILLADPTGVGKSIMALGVANLMKARRMLVICPASVKSNWEKEAKRWLEPKADVYRVSAQLGWPPTKQQCDRELFIINYDIINRYLDKLADHWDLVVADESHFLKGGEKTQRGQAFYDNIQNADKVLFLTATPLKNHPVELWAQISFLDPFTWHRPDGKSKHFEFHQNYCGSFETEHGWAWKGDPSTEDLQALETKLRQTIMIRRNKIDVLKDLPPKFRRIIELPCDSTTMERIQTEQVFWDETVDHYKQLKQALKEAQLSADENAYREQVKRMNQGMLEIAGAVSRQRQITALYKIPYAIRFIEDLVEGGENKVVVFGHHRAVLESIHQAYAQNSVLFYGGMSEKKKETALRRFAHDAICHLFVGSILAAGLGLNELCVAQQAIFVELTYVPADITQAEDRLHRHGQKSSVVISQLVFPGTIDAKITNVLIEKQKMIDAALDGGTKSSDGQKSVLETILENDAG